MEMCHGTHQQQLLRGRAAQTCEDAWWLGKEMQAGKVDDDVNGRSDLGSEAVAQTGARCGVWSFGSFPIFFSQYRDGLQFATSHSEPVEKLVAFL